MKMATLELTEQNFEEHTNREGITLVDFSASWCEPCQQFAPIFEQISEQHPDVLFGTVDTDANPDLVAAFDVSAIPMLMIVRNRVVVYEGAGALPESVVEDLLRQTRELDMKDAPVELQPRSEDQDQNQN
jgi:thioredoxin 1